MKKFVNFLKEYSIFAILVVLAVIFSMGNPAFLKPSNILTILRQSCIMGILGMGEMSLIVVGGLYGEYGTALGGGHSHQCGD